MTTLTPRLLRGLRACPCPIMLPKVAVNAQASSLRALAMRPGAPAVRLEPLGVRWYAKKSKQKKGAAVEEDDTVSVAKQFDSTKLDERMISCINSLKEHLASMRLGRANPALLDTVRVRIDNSNYSLRDLAQVTIRDPQTLLVTVHDSDLLSSVDKGIREAGLNLNPVIDNKIIRVPIPKPTKESREKMAKLAQTNGEQAKGKIRLLRQDGMKQLKLDAKQQSADETKKLEKTVQTMTDKYNKAIDELIKSKIKEIQS
ncbi:hypothetical protein EC973_008482 [Apophysomyces ossiformis]|uniref:Ribosome recycling factor domain-containing protein n=1 Tax=Apophysomyces ossiformis TaxID=679940 RepID=A0A8H7ETM9_9FUNG|nr:hypothetical protein EC973_008482 [Apophysomyces ossiformis]